MKKYLDYSILLLFFLSVHPVVFKHLFPLLGYPLSFSCLGYAVYTLLRKRFIKISKNRKIFICSLSIFIVWQLVLSFISQRIYFALNAVQFISIIIMLFYAYSIEEKENLKLYLSRFFAILISLALISFTLAQIFKPEAIVEFSYSSQGSSKLVYFTFANLYFPFNGFMRFSSIFEEAGTLSSYIIIISASILPIKNRLKNSKIILFFGTLFSTSLGYFLAVFSFLFSYFSLFFIKSISSLKISKNTSYFLFFTFLALIIGFLSINFIIPGYVSSRVFRLQNIFEEGRFQAFQNDLKIFKMSPIFGQSLNLDPLPLRGNNPASTLAEYGFIGSLIYFLPFLTYLKYVSNLYYSDNPKRISVIFALLTLLLHRPEIVFPSLSLIIGILII